LRSQPEISWPNSEREALYVMLVENSGHSAERSFIHFLAYNIPGQKLANADVAMNWLPPFRQLLNYN